MKILSAIVLSFIFTMGAYAEMTATNVTGGATSDVKYEVTFKVVYNAVSAERAAEIAKEIMTNHQDACKVEVRSVKNGGDNLTLSNDTTNYIISPQPRWIVTE